MTTFAYRNGVLVSDTAVTMSGQYIGTTVKIAKKGPFLAAASGTASLARGFMDWFSGGMKDKPVTFIQNGKEDWSCWGYIFCPDGLMLSFEPSGVNHHRSEFLADGSGAQLAMGAMAYGASAKKAVRIACQYDISSREPITILRHES